MNLNNYRKVARTNLLMTALLMIIAIGLSVCEVVPNTLEVQNAVEWALGCFFAAGYFITNWETINRLIAEIERIRAGKEESSS